MATPNKDQERTQEAQSEKREAGMQRHQEDQGVTRTGEQPQASYDPFSLMRELMGWGPFQQMMPALAQRTWSPRFEVKETPKAYIFTADLPGVKDSDINMELTNNRLTISGSREEEASNEDERYFAFERSYGSFSRTFVLPEGVEMDNIEADLKDGVLRVAVPKGAAHQARKIVLKRMQDIKGKVAPH